MNYFNGDNVIEAQKLLIFHPYLTPYRIDLYNRLAQIFQVSALLTGSTSERSTLAFDQEFVNQQAHFKFTSVERGVYIGRHLISIIFFKQIQSIQPNVILAHELGINTIIAIFLKPFFKYKLLVTVDDSPSMMKTYGRFRKIIQKFIVKHSEAMLTVHPDVNSYLAKKYSVHNSCQFIYFPIIQDDVKLNRKLDMAEFETYNLLSRHDLGNKKIILFVGRLESVKCPDMLLEVFHNLNEDNKTLVLVGEGSMKTSLKHYVEENGLEKEVIFTGRLSGSALYAWYRLADVFVLPSQFEPFGAVVNEALVAGCKVIVSDQVGANSLINLSNGIMFNYRNRQDLLKALETIIEPVPCEAKGCMRKSRMPISFENLFTKLVNFIKK